MIVTALETMSTLLAINCDTHNTLTLSLDLVSEQHHHNQDKDLPLLYQHFLDYLSRHEEELTNEIVGAVSGDNRAVESIEICIDCQIARRVSKVADQWFSDYLRVNCFLVVQTDGDPQIPSTVISSSLGTTQTTSVTKSFSNSGQFLMISKQSVENLEEKVSVLVCSSF
jgi:hypothetical protein